MPARARDVFVSVRSLSATLVAVIVCACTRGDGASPPSDGAADTSVDVPVDVLADASTDTPAPPLTDVVDVLADAPADTPAPPPTDVVDVPADDTQTPTDAPPLVDALSDLPGSDVVDAPTTDRGDAGPPCSVDTDCAPGTLCRAGACTPGCTAARPCPFNQTCCDSQCADTAADTRNCGACGRLCAAGTTCCNGACANPLVDARHCGACGAQCAPPHAMPACIAGNCQVVGCEAGSSDCDADPTNGCETTVSTDALHCGRCGNACAAGLHASPVCDRGACGIACEAGFSNCDGAPANGCEVDTTSDSRNCGACGRACAVGANATASCVAGACVARCLAGFGDCDGNADNGCEVTLATDARNCGGCGIACGFANATARCAAGSCALDRCAAGFGDCNGDPADGCEQNTATDATRCGGCTTRCASGMYCSAGVCTLSCAAPTTLCAGACANTATDPMNCGRCGNACPRGAHSTATCAAGVCGLACDRGFGNCDAMASTGCEADLTTSTAHCGGCGITCSATGGTPRCTGGSCGITCATSRADCNGYVTDGCEVDTTTSAAHCGGCGRACGAVNNGTPGCRAGACNVGSCTAPWANCNGNAADGCETDTSGDAYNCGTCGRTCAVFMGMNPCGNSTCLFASDCRRMGLAYCITGSVSTCVNTQTHPLHCGACGRACPSGQVCTAGACVNPPPPNDVCANATNIDLAAGSRVTLNATTANATHNLDAPCNGVGGADVFYRFTLTRREYVYADTLASPGFDTKLFFASSCTAALTTRTTGDLVCNDNGGAGCGGTGVRGSQVFTLLPAGTWYLVLSVQAGSVGSASLRFEHVPAGNGSTTALAQGASTLSGTTSGTDGARGSCGGTGPENSYWWVTCPSFVGGAFSASTCGRASWNTLLYVLNGSGVGDACNNDGAGTCGDRSSLNATIAAGSGLHALFVDGFVDGAGVSSGAYTVALTRP